MRGERCSSLLLDRSGVGGDRRFAFTSSRAPVGKPLLASDERAAMLLYQPRLKTDGSICVVTPSSESFDLHDPELLQHIEARLRTPTRLALIQSPARALTDVRPVALHSIQSARALTRTLPGPRQADDRRLRSNIVLDFASDVPFVENAYAGQTLHLGQTAQIRVLEQIPRCRIVSLDPETAETDGQLLTYLGHHHHARAGVYASVVTPGEVEVGDPVQLAT